MSKRVHTDSQVGLPNDYAAGSNNNCLLPFNFVYALVLWCFLHERNLLRESFVDCRSDLAANAHVVLLAGLPRPIRTQACDGAYAYATTTMRTSNFLNL